MLVLNSWIVTLGISVVVSTVVALPVVLVGVMAIFMQAEFGLGEAELGTAIAAYFAGAALSSVPMGKLAARVGPRTTTRLALAFSAASLVGIGMAASSSLLPLFLAIGGIGNASGQLSMDLQLTRSVPARSQGLAFGTKQAGLPLAGVIAGLSMPAIGLTVGWRWAFIAGALAAPIIAWKIPRGHLGGPRRNRPRTQDAPRRALILLALGIGLAAMGASASVAFIVPSLVNRGSTLADAGLLVAMGSFVTIVIRVLAGRTADVLNRGSLLLVVALFVAGACGYVGLAFLGGSELTILSTMLVFGGGRGFTGLTLLALSRSNPSDPSTAMGIVQVGPMTGSVLGPLAFGALAEHISFSAGWLFMAASALAGVGMILLARQLILGAQRI